MVVRQTHDGWYLVTQPDHARLAGRLAAHWCSPLLPAPRQPWFVEAVARHDAGWGRLDREPAFDAHGAPVSFLHWPLTSAVAAWRRSAEEASRIGESAGYIVRRHFCLLAEMAMARGLSDADRGAVTQFIKESDPTPHQPELEAATQLLQICDLLSLQLTTGGQMSTALLARLGMESRFEAGSDVLQLRPFPFDQDLEFDCPARFLAAGSRIPSDEVTKNFHVIPLRD